MDSNYVILLKVNIPSGVTIPGLSVNNVCQLLLNQKQTASDQMIYLTGSGTIGHMISLQL